MFTHSASHFDSNVSFVVTRGKVAVAKAQSAATKYSRHAVVASSAHRTVLGDKTNGVLNFHGNSNLNTGRWTKSERLAFLRGLRRHGKSKWRDIARGIVTR